ncbi:MAG: restriction endonuclease subunit S [Gallionella sp.]|nr:restriction endonuclease subunit S [Gallionella sp.]
MSNHEAANLTCGAEWRQHSLGELCSLITDGKHGDCCNEAGSGYYFLSVKDVFGGRLVYDNGRQITEVDFLETHRRTNLRAGDILFTNTGTIGRMAIAPDDPRTMRTTFQKSVAILKPKKEIVLPRFLYYVLQFDNARLSDFAAGTTQKNLLLKDLRAFSVQIPPLAEQKAIAHILGTLDDKIEMNRRMNATLETMARALFQSWFVDFDPIRAKLDGRKPAGLDATTAALFPAHFQDSPLGHIPQGWEVKPMSEVIEVNPRRTLKSGAISPYLDMKNMPTQGHAADEVIHRKFSSGTKFQNGDTLLARITPCLENGKSAFVDFLEEGQVGWGSTEYIVFAPKPPLTPEFGYYLARSDALRLHAIQNMTGTSGRQRVPSECFAQFQIAVPSAKIAQRFGEITKPWMTMIHANIEQSRTLATLRDTLLPKLLSGELSVADAKKIAGGSA